jgi:hypothetical protein
MQELQSGDSELQRENEIDEERDKVLALLEHKRAQKAEWKASRFPEGAEL